MNIEQVNISDLEIIRELNPPNWSDIVPFFKFYIDSDFCSPIKVITDDKITGIGTSIRFKNSAWLAHIIVDANYRNRGIGRAIVDALVEDLLYRGFPTIFLIATKLGEPVYRKAGFEDENEYLFLKDGFSKDVSIQEKLERPDRVIIFNDKYKDDLLSFDAKVTGEIRSDLLLEHFSGSKLYVKNNRVTGYYLPTLGEGLIIADNPEAGLDLLKLKFSVTDKIVLPVNNKTGVQFLLNNNFKEVLRGLRMRLGEKIEFHPDKLYSRIGGHVG